MTVATKTVGYADSPVEEKPYRWVGDCVSLASQLGVAGRGEFLNDLREGVCGKPQACGESEYEIFLWVNAPLRSISYRTFQKHCSGTKQWEVDHGYSLNRRNDKNVSYHKAKLHGCTVYFLLWTFMEHVWMRPDDYETLQKHYRSI